MLAEGTEQQVSIASERAQCLCIIVVAHHECLPALTMLIHDSFSLECEHEEQEEEDRCEGGLEEAGTEQQIQQPRRRIRRTTASPMRSSGEHESVSMRSIVNEAVSHRQCSGEASAAATAVVRLQRRVGEERRRQRQTMLTATSSDRHVRHCYCQGVHVMVSSLLLLLRVRLRRRIKRNSDSDSNDSAMQRAHVRHAHEINGCTGRG